MKNSLFTLLFTCTTLGCCFAQQIEMKKVFGGYKYSQNGKNLNMGSLVKTVKTNPKAYELIKSAQSKTVIGSIFSYAGGALIGYQLGTAIAGGEGNWAVAAVGAGLIGIAIPFSVSANKKIKQAVTLYNASAPPTPTSSYRIQPEFKIILNAKQVGLALQF